ncbi:hypothetical protein I5H93_gp030 [Mycobacterium phage SuperGrey]|uniref:Uncharacterized protein n=17 Tax=Cheoctovirus TaxID=1623281 RepID=A0A249XQ10_9CAUD|nr:hypothetical protein BOOMER_31 [Mycobacterium phage Boomer]YP_002241818.1 gp31 [Mycobacterium phage Ramsey]YP_008126623.1 hypothetical protein M609_gp033 [Mycobacterium phage Job42]YP_008409562.1 hypothetical protein N858_gp025 [Mycobacterium phage Velveteen]YP_009125025.1 hypothetical protein PBI_BUZZLYSEYEAR_32 [Mycobacterium phage BuzzLyseyear]YP_009125209.1 hypothetical protein PBI_HADES_30 [Mycobacterium phage Hades]YP_009125878.1 hypothetical protein VC45_gp025 [Mycobacterium phage C
MKVTYRGMEIELELRVGFTVHNQDGSSYIQVHVTPTSITGGGPDGDGGEPLPIERAA